MPSGSRPSAVASPILTVVSRPVLSSSRESPSHAPPRSAATHLDVGFDPAVLLLKVLRPQEHALGPDHPIAAGHRLPLPVRQSPPERAARRSGRASPRGASSGCAAPRRTRATAPCRCRGRRPSRREIALSARTPAAIPGARRDPASGLLAHQRLAQRPAGSASSAKKSASMNSLAVASFSTRTCTGRPVPSASALTSGAALSVRLTTVGGGGGGGGGGAVAARPRRTARRPASAELARRAVAGRRESDHRRLSPLVPRLGRARCPHLRRAETAARPRERDPGSAP